MEWCYSQLGQEYENAKMKEQAADCYAEAADRFPLPEYVNKALDRLKQVAPDRPIPQVVFSKRSEMVGTNIQPQASDEWGILFDLDQTLVNTSSIEDLRQKHLWNDVFQSFPKTSLPPCTLEFINTLREIKNFHLGVVTMSPRSYAEKLLAYHKLPLPVLVGWHDAPFKKPDPTQIRKAAEILGIPLQRTIHIGDDIIDILAASRAGVSPIAISWDHSLDNRNETADAVRYLP